MNDTNLPETIKVLGQRVVFKKGTQLYNPSSQVAKCYFIVSGLIKVYIDHDNGRRSVLDFFTKGHWLGEFSLFQNEPDVKENLVLTDTVCYVFSKDALKALCLADASISYYFAEYLTDKLIRRTRRMSQFLNYPLDVRLARFILEVEQNGRYKVPHTDVSEYMNVSYRHILHVIQKFCQEGLLERNKGYVILNYDALKERALLSNTP